MRIAASGPSATASTNNTFAMSEQDASKQQQPRRFAPEPIETTTKSSKSTRRFAPEPIETTTKSSKSARRFAPEPVETTTRSSRKEGEEKVGGSGDSSPAPRRFAPQPVETSQRSSKERSKGKEVERENSTSSTRVRFKPQLVETVYGGSRSSASSSRRTTQDDSSTVGGDEATPRKFKPEILSTAKRSRRAGEKKKGNAREYKTEDGFQVHAREHRKHTGWKTPAETHLAPPSGSSAADPDFSSELRRHIAPLDGSASPTSRPVERSHSFRCPDLDTIESSESERESGPSSISCSPGRGSPITASDSSYNDFPYKHATRERESVDENFSHYLLKLEAEKAHARLQEQALAAFPNSDFHEPISHFVNDDNESDDMEIDERPSTWEGFDEEIFFNRARRESTNKVSWEQLEMQRHAEQLEQERNANKPTAARTPENSPWWNPAAGLNTEQQDPDMQSMRDRARPPMLGNDLKFPRCPSPEPARFDVTQGSAKLRQQMLAESNNPVVKAEEKGGLWMATCKKPSTAQDSTSSAASKAKSSTKGGGLWGGFCVGTPSAANTASPTPGGLAPNGIPTGLMTPAPRSDSSNPFELSFAARNGGPSSLKKTPPTPPPEGLTGTDLANLDAVLVSDRDFEAMMEKEYPDSFVTQVYNYISLGYPTLARPFDEELSKISGIPISELREDDEKAKAMPKGYIRLDPAYEGKGGDGVKGDGCVRWRALKLYVREWARQEKKGYADVGGANWGATARRGSWAW